MAISWAGTAWGTSTPYLLNARVVNAGNIYRCTSPGTSAASGGGPTGTSASITDGTVTWAYLGVNSGAVIDAYPALAALAATTPQQALWLGLAERLVADDSADVWGEFLDDGRRALAAHFGFLAQLDGTGPITSESIGPASRSYAALMTDDALSMTPAGLAYRSLYQTLPTVFGLTV